MQAGAYSNRLSNKVRGRSSFMGCPLAHSIEVEGILSCRALETRKTAVVSERNAVFFEDGIGAGKIIFIVMSIRQGPEALWQLMGLWPNFLSRRATVRH